MVKAKKPSRAAILAAVPLSALATCGADPALVCNLCGRPSADLGVWHECDERDEAGPTPPLVFIGKDDAHADCRARMEAHPRLYREVTGMPGHFPLLCGGCPYRKRFICTHPKLKANGGEGLRVRLSGGWVAGVIVCSRTASQMPVRVATDCEGEESAALAAEAARHLDSEGEV